MYAGGSIEHAEVINVGYIRLRPRLHCWQEEKPIWPCGWTSSCSMCACICVWCVCERSLDIPGVCPSQRDAFCTHLVHMYALHSGNLTT